MPDLPWTPVVRTVPGGRCAEILDGGRWWPGWTGEWQQHRDGRWSAIVAWVGPEFVHRTSRKWAEELRPATGWTAADVSAPGHSRRVFTSHPDSITARP